MYKDLYIITEVWTTGTVNIYWRAVQEIINIIWFKPYHKEIANLLITFK